jgi:hypothetical protein
MEIFTFLETSMDTLLALSQQLQRLFGMARDEESSNWLKGTHQDGTEMRIRFK